MTRYSAIGIFGLAFLLAIMSAASVAGDGAPISTNAAAILKLGGGARAQALGGAYTAMVGDPFSLYYNPAGIGAIARKGIFSEYRYFSFDTHYQIFGFTSPLGVSSNVAISHQNLSVDRIAMRSGPTNEPEGWKSAGASVSAVSFAFNPIGSLLIGVNAKYINESLIQGSNSGFAADLGMIYPLGGWNIGLAFANLGPAIENFALPSRLSLGIASPVFLNYSMLCMDIAYHENGAVSLHGGSELKLGLLAFQAGYARDLSSAGNEAQSRFQIGAGIDFQSLLLNYAWSSRIENMQEHRLSLAYCFGADKDDIWRAKMKDIQAQILANENSPLKIQTAFFRPLLPLEIAKENSPPLGFVSVQNFSNESFDDLCLTLRAPFTESGRQQIIIPMIAGQSDFTCPIIPNYQGEYLKSRMENETIGIEVTLDYYQSRRKYQVRGEYKIDVLNRNSIDWSNREAIAAFVDPADPSIISLTRALMVVTDTFHVGALSRRLNQAALLFDFFYFASFRYVADPNQRFRGELMDRVQFPFETLRDRSGDCDDLSVLYVSLLESIGIPCALISTPTHILPAFNTGCPAVKAACISVDTSRYFIYKQEIWIPVEVTAIGPFREAWRRGLASYQDAKALGEFDFVDIAPARATFNPLEIRDSSLHFDWSAATSNDQFFSFYQNDIQTIQSINDSLALINYLKRKKTLETKSGTARDWIELIQYAGVAGQIEDLIQWRSPQNLALRFNDPGLWNAIGNLWVLNQSFREALAPYQSAWRESGEKAGIAFNLSLVYYHLGEYKTSREWLKKSLEKARDDDEARRITGFSLMTLRQARLKLDQYPFDDKLQRVLYERIYWMN